jgi:hypothetical protein
MRLRALALVIGILMLAGCGKDEIPADESGNRTSGVQTNGFMERKETHDGRWVWCLYTLTGHGGTSSCDWVDYHERYEQAAHPQR